MQIIELDRSYCRKEYGGDFAAMIQSRDGLIYDDELIRRGFRFGAGTVADFRQYVENNRKYCRYYDLTAHAYI